METALPIRKPPGSTSCCPPHANRPRGSLVSIALYAAFAVLVLAAAGAVALLPDGFVAVAIWVLTGYFVLGIAMNAISRSRPERLVMTPVVALLAAACLVLALG